jgi:hypothetical protein
MRRISKLFVASAAMALTLNQAYAVDILFQKNGFADLSGGQVTGFGIPTTPIGNNSTDVLLTGLTPLKTYSVDFFHNTGTGSSDFSFTLDSAGNIATIGLGGGLYTMASGVGSTTLSLNTFSVTYNANKGQTGNYGIGGMVPATGINSRPKTFDAIPGKMSVDHLYNTGIMLPAGDNDDFTFAADSSGNVTIPTGSNGPVSHPIAWSEFATPSGNTVNVNHILAHYRVEASGAITLNVYQPIQNLMALGGNVYEFDIDLTIGNGGFFISSFGNYTIGAGNAVQPDGTSWTGVTGTNDYAFKPLLRYDPTYANGYDYYFENGTDGKVATGSATGFYDGNVNPLSVTVTATLVPEPASLGLLAAGGLLMLRRRRAR